jgi:hypothetical protein
MATSCGRPTTISSSTAAQASRPTRSCTGSAPTASTSGRSESSVAPSLTATRLNPSRTAKSYRCRAAPRAWRPRPPGRRLGHIQLVVSREHLHRQDRLDRNRVGMGGGVDALEAQETAGDQQAATWRDVLLDHRRGSITAAPNHCRSSVPLESVPLGRRDIAINIRRHAFVPRGREGQPGTTGTASSDLMAATGARRPCDVPPLPSGGPALARRQNF